MAKIASLSLHPARGAAVTAGGRRPPRGLRLGVLPGLLLTVAALLPPPALAQWQWLDANGRRVFSDRPPPPEVPPQRILRQPQAAMPAAPLPPSTETSAVPSAPPAPSAEPARAGASVPRSPASVAQDARRQQAEADRQRSEQERVARLRTENCGRARSAKATIDAGVRLTRTNERGEQEILDDAGRAAESRRLQAIIASDC